MALTVRQWRRLKDYTQANMAEKLGIHINTYQNWEDHPEKISIENAVKLSEIFDVTLNEIIFNKEKGE